MPSAFPLLAKAGIEVVIESGAGVAAGFPDGAFKDKGARASPRRAEVLEAARVLLQVRPLRGRGERDRGHGRRHVLVGLLDPLGAPAGIQTLAARGLTAFALELIPRITRAQAMDVLSSAATITGYKAVLLAASALPQMFPMLMTAGGTLAPARVFVIGAGVAGLQAIATARRLGAVVQRLRRAAGGQGAGREPGREVRRAAAGSRGRAGQGRLRARPWTSPSTGASARRC